MEYAISTVSNPQQSHTGYTDEAREAVATPIPELNALADDGWRVIGVIGSNDSCFITVLLEKA